MIFEFLYAYIYYYVMGVIVVFYSITTFTSRFDAGTLKRQLNINGPLLFLFLVITFYMGLRPISIFFGDMGTYANTFNRIKYSPGSAGSGDFLFDWYMRICAPVMNDNTWFLLTAFLYIYPLYLISVRRGGKYAGYCFLMLVVSFSFWTYGTNGIRNGLATSIFIWALACNNVIIRWCLIFLAAGVHGSMNLLAGAYILTLFVKKPKLYFIGWLLAIPVSLVAGGFFQGLFAGVMDDGRTSYLTDGNVNNDEFSSTGFRWDFLLYSAAPVYNAYYFIIKRNFNDKFYNQLVSIYLTANAFWILVIKANFSNRFAYLSWFLMAIVIAYPWIKERFHDKQTQKMVYILLAYFAFTFFMNAIL